MNVALVLSADISGFKRAHSSDSGANKRARPEISASPGPTSSEAAAAALVPSAAEFLAQMLKQAQMLSQSGGEPPCDEFAMRGADKSKEDEAQWAVGRFEEGQAIRGIESSAGVQALGQYSSFHGMTLCELRRVVPWWS